MAILGLLNTESLDAQRFKNIRRSVFYDYPNGSSPLLGLMSLMTEEPTNDPEFRWYEKRLKQQRSLTVSNTYGPFGATNGDAAANSVITQTVGTSYSVKVALNEQFHIGHVIRIPVTTGTGAAQDTLIGLITSLISTNQIVYKSLKTVTNLDNAATYNIGKEVIAIGSAAEQSQVGAGLSVYNVPTDQYNYCQLFRNAFRIDGTALKTSVKYDETGPYADQAKEASIDHLRGMEFAFLFGERTKLVDGTTNLVTYTTGGILWYLKQWELTSNNPYEMSGASVDSDDNKRIITNSKGYLTEKEWDIYMERLFRIGNNRTNERLCLCGSGALNSLNRMFKGSTMLTSDLPMSDTYGMSVVKCQTPFGVVYFKTHPLFSQNDTLRFNMLFLDVLNLKYRFVTGRDSELLTERQPNNADYREDEWFGQCGLDLKQPESNMYIQNFADYR